MTWTFSPMAAAVLPDIDRPAHLRRGYRCCHHCSKRRRWAPSRDHHHENPCLRIDDRGAPCPGATPKGATG